MQLSCPEFRLRGLPRITVRGQTVQGGRFLLRKAPLPSRMCPWCTRRHCGPLAFRCATEGSRSAKEGLGESRGGKGTTCALAPFCLRRQTAAFPPVNTGNSPAVGTASPPPKAAIVHAHLERKVAYSGAPLYRRKVYRLPTVKRKGAPLRFLQKIICKALTTSDVRIIM